MTLQPAAILFPDADLWGVGMIRIKLATRTEPYKSGAVVSNAVPPTRPARLVTIRRDGGSVAGVFDRPRFGVNVWAENEKDAADLARLVSALFLQAPGDGVCVSLRQLSGPSPIPDAQPRRYMTFEATLRGTPL